MSDGSLDAHRRRWMDAALNIYATAPSNAGPALFTPELRAG
jgi:hypothetical protein